MAKAEQVIQEAGATILREIGSKQPVFLVEIEHHDLHLDAIFSQLGRTGRWGWGSEHKAAAAWAAVQLAARSEAEDLQDEGGFRRLFFSKLGRDFSLNDWQDTFGYHIRQFLEEQFPAVDLPDPGPWHLVGAVYRHAGIPANSKAGYAEFVAKMLRGELNFTYQEYREKVKAFSSPVVRQFLESSAGYEYTRDLARKINRVYQGGAYPSGLAAWTSHLLDAVVDLLREVGASPKELKPPRGFSKPYLSLDAETSSLRIVFDPRGVRERYYWTATRPVLYASQPVKEELSPRFRRGFASAPEPVSPWWTPAQGSWALFRTGDGALVSDGSRAGCNSVRAGKYYLVTDNPAAIPEEVAQDSPVPLEGIDSAASDFGFVRISLGPGSSIPALGLSADNHPPLPKLEWIAPRGLETAWGAGIFLEKLPAIRVHSWDSASAANFSFTVEDGEGDREVVVPVDGEISCLPVRCPDSGYLAIRRRGLPRKIIDRLTFGVLPAGCHLYLPADVLRSDRTAQLAVELPAEASVQWSTPVVQLGPGTYEIGGHEHGLDGKLLFRSPAVRTPSRPLDERRIVPGGSRSEISFSVRLPRASLAIELDGIAQPLLWKEFCDRKYALGLEVPAGMASTVLVGGEESLYPLLNQQPRARSWFQKVPIGDFRDAALTFPHAAGELILRLKDKHSADIDTGCYLASAHTLARSLLSLGFDSTVFRIPKLGPLLLEYRSLVERPAIGALPIPGVEIPAELSVYLADLRCLAGSIDGSPRNQTSTGFVSGDRDWAELSKWFGEALECARAGLPDSAVQTKLPLATINALPVPRWIEQIKALTRKLAQNATLPTLIEDFRGSFEPVVRRGGATLCARMGGMDLWDATNSYRLALQGPELSPRDLTRQLQRFGTIVSAAENDAVVRYLAQAFQFMDYYRLDRRSMLETAAFSSWPPLLSPLLATLAALRAESTGHPVETVWPTSGVGLAEISPALKDSELERRLGRPGTTYVT